MKYITKYQTVADYRAAKAQRGYPNVSLINGESNVRFNMDASAINLLTFTALEDGQFMMTMPSYAYPNYLSYSLDNGQTWSTLSANTWSPTVEAGHTIQWNGGLSSLGFDYHFSSTGTFTASGDPASILVNENRKDFSCMFLGCTGLTDASALVMPSTMNGYTYLNNMFNGCTSLTAAPALPATTLVSRCYEYMFQNCTSLTTAPELPATSLATYCYHEMFKGCSNLSSITCLATDGFSMYQALQGWVDGVAATGTFTKAASMTDWPTGVNGIPTGWTVQDYSN